VDGIPLWQNILQNNDGSWRVYYSNRQGCKHHKGVITSWLGCDLAHLKFHLLKRGITEESALALIQASFSPQALQDALNATMKNGRVVLAVQAELADKMDDMMKQAFWVGIRKGTEMSELLEYEQEMQGRSQLLDPNKPKALNFAEEQSMKSLHTAATGATQYTAAFSVSMGNTAYMPGDNTDVKSVESDLFELGGR
jgi:hypothetical protein